MQYEVKTYTIDGNEKIVGFMVRSDSGALLAIDKRVAIKDGKTDEQYMQEALALAKAEIDEWASHEAVVGKKFDPATGTFI